MALNSKIDKLIAIILLLVLVGFMIYQARIFIPGWAYHYEHESGVAKITELRSVGNDKILVYSYYNKYLEREITNTREIVDLKYWQKLNNQQDYSITYAKYFPSLVVFSSLDKEPLFVMRIIIYLIELIALGLVIGVLLNKVSLETLAGVNKDEPLEEE